MLFNSLEYLIFLPVVFILYWFVFKNNLQLQNILILLSSYVFYGWWDWRFLSLIVISTLVDYCVGQGLKRSQLLVRRKFFLIISLTVNLGILGFFKYFNFFIESFVDMFASVGVQMSTTTLNIILPVGISFYTFQTLSYSIDLYRKKIQPTDNIIEFAAFVAFFPQLVAGPIERAENLLPQFSKVRKFEYNQAVDGCRQILWGLFKKMVIADNCAVYVNNIFSDPSIHSGSTLLLGAVFFAFQIYGDFSGYSDIAIGSARLFGFNLMRNFSYPYFSRDIAEFWRRWHISLSTWFRDYLYIPLGGNSGSTLRIISNVIIVFTVSGFWHGASWNFILWGLLNAILFLPLIIFKKNRKHLDIVAKKKKLPSAYEFFQILFTFFLVTNAWILFRADNLQQALIYYINLYQFSLFSIPEIFPKNIIVLLVLFVLFEWVNRDKQYSLQITFDTHGIFRNLFIRWSGYAFLSLLIIGCGGEKQEFIYFAF